MDGARPAAALLATLVALAACGGPRSLAQLPEVPAARPAAAQDVGSYGAEAPVALLAVEEEAIALARRRLARGGPPPELSPALVRAARELAGRTLAGEDSTAPAAVRAALARALAADAAPSVIVQRAAAAEAPSLLSESVSRSRATHLGVGAAPAPDGGVVLVLLASERGARLDPFPRHVEPGASATLSGKLRSGLARPRVVVAGPAGAIAEVPVQGAATFRARVTFPVRGRYAVEVVAEGASGPTVVALLAISAGGAPLEPPPRRAAAAPAEGADAEAAVVREINGTRRRAGLPALAPSPALAAVARAHSEAMLAAGEVAHVLPTSPEVGARLRRAGLPYRRAFENVARSRTALDAHEIAEASPAHLANVLQRGPGHVGVGIARGQLGTGDPIVYLTEIYVEEPDDGRSSPYTLDARVRAALWAERARREAPALTADARLDALAAEAARRMRAADRPSEGDLAERALALGRGLAAVDVYVASGPEEATRSRNLPDPRFRRVGVGVAGGTGGRFGSGRVWIAVVYTD